MNRLVLLGIGIIMIGLIACSDKDRIPSGVLPKDTMESVLWDMIQAERYTNSFVVDSTHNGKAENFKFYAQIFELHKINKDEFIKSYKFYMSRPDIAKVMFDSLASKANRIREKMYEPKTKPADTSKAVNLKRDSSAKPALLPAHPMPGQPPVPIPAHAFPTPVTPQPANQPKQNVPAFHRAPPTPFQRLNHVNKAKDSLIKLQRVP